MLAAAPDYARSMMHRPLSRLLLSLLILWQLLASVIAHPLPASLNESASAINMQMHSEHCAQHPSDNDSLLKHQYSGCGANCHCPCAGTAALTMTLPMMPPPMAATLIDVLPDTVEHSYLPAMPLRPPIV